MRCATDDDLIIKNLSKTYHSASKSVCAFDVVNRLYELISPIYWSGLNILNSLAEAGDPSSVERLNHAKALESGYLHNVRMHRARTGDSNLKIRFLETSMHESFSEEAEIIEFLEGFGLGVCELRVNLREVLVLIRRILSILFSLDRYFKCIPLELHHLPCSASTIGSHVRAYAIGVRQLTMEFKGRERRVLEKPSGKVISLQAWRSAS